MEQTLGEATYNGYQYKHGGCRQTTVHNKSHSHIVGCVLAKCDQFEHQGQRHE